MSEQEGGTSQTLPVSFRPPLRGFSITVLTAIGLAGAYLVYVVIVPADRVVFEDFQELQVSEERQKEIDALIESHSERREIDRRGDSETNCL